MGLSQKITLYLFAVLLLLLISGCAGKNEEPAGTVPSSSTSADTGEDKTTNVQEAQQDEEVSVFAGTLNLGYADGANLMAEFIKPYGLCEGPQGGLLVVDCYANMLRASSKSQTTTLAGNTDIPDQSGYPLFGYSNGAALEALLNHPRFATVSAEGTIVFSDTGNHCIRILQDGTVRLLAGTQTPGFQNGSYETARFDTPSGVAIGADGTVYVADTLNHCIRAISSEGQVTTLAGVPQKSGFQDGAPGEALFCEPNDIELGPDGSLYVVDKGNQRIRRITTGEVTTVAGSGTEADSVTGYIIGGYTDGESLQAQFKYPTGLSIAADGTIYVADTGNHCIRSISPDGTTTTVAGSKMPGSENGSSKEARFNQPLDVLFSEGGLYVSDSYNHVIRFIRLLK